MTKRFIAALMVLTTLCVMQSANAEPFDLDAFELSAHQTEAQTVEHEGRDRPLLVGEGGGYPAIHLTPADGPLDLTGHSAVRFTVTNVGERGTRVHGRVDNPGPWQDNPWSVNAQRVRPGQTATITVTFGQSYGNRAYALDPARIKALVLFVDRPGDEVRLRIDEVEPVEGDPASDDAADGGAQTPAIDGILHDFERDVSEALTTDGTTASRVQTDDGHALEVSYDDSQKYPGVQLKAMAGQAWNLSAFGHVEVDVTNVGEQAATAALRLDNAGDWSDQPWNVEREKIEPGETRTIRVTFGRSWGAPAYELNPGRVVLAVVYVERPKAGTTLRLDNLRAAGSPAELGDERIGLDGILFDFESPLPEQRLDQQDVDAEVKDGKLNVTFTGGTWPAAYLLPRGRKWDLSNFQSVQMEVTNTGEKKVTVLARVDNPNATGNANSNSEKMSLNPGQTRTMTVTFGRSWGGQGFGLDTSNVVGILVGGDRPPEGASITVDNIKANVKEVADLPEWLGEQPPVEGDWVMTLDETFDSDELDDELWTPRLVWDGPANHEIQRYREQNILVEDGKLVIRIEKNPGHQYDDESLPERDYATGAVTSLDKWTQRYGYIEARLKRPTTRGTWPAFWLMPDRGEDSGLDIWKRRTTSDGGMEIDIWEHLTEWGAGRYNAAVHWDGYGDGHKSWGSSNLTHLPTEDGWHTFGLLWEPGKLTWYADGKKMLEWDNERVTDVPLYIKFTVQMGGWATNDVNDASLPDRFEIDYVRAWQLRERVEE